MPTIEVKALAGTVVWIVRDQHKIVRGRQTGPDWHVIRVRVQATYQAVNENYCYANSAYYPEGNVFLAEPEAKAEANKRNGKGGE